MGGGTRKGPRAEPATQGDVILSKERCPEPSPRDQAYERAEGAISLDAYSPEYLRACTEGDAREQRLAELKRRIQARAYRVDAGRIAEELLLRGDL